MGSGPFRAGTVEFLQRRIAVFGEPPADLSLTIPDGTSSDQAVFRELLGSHSDYGGVPQSVVALSLARLSIPSGIVAPVAPFDNMEFCDSPSADEFV